MIGVTYGLRFVGFVQATDADEDVRAAKGLAAIG